jgi:hypothetical protein
MQCCHFSLVFLPLVDHSTQFNCVVVLENSRHVVELLVAAIDINKCLKLFLFHLSFFEFFSQHILNFVEELVVGGRLFHESFQTVTILFSFTFSVVGDSIFGEEGVMDNLFVVFVEALDVLLDGVEEETAEGGAARLPEH